MPADKRKTYHQRWTRLCPQSPKTKTDAAAAAPSQTGTIIYEKDFDTSEKAVSYDEKYRVQKNRPNVMFKQIYLKIPNKKSFHAEQMTLTGASPGVSLKDTALRDGRN